MNAADFAAMADPTKNPQFRRGWAGPPPDPEKRKRRSLAGAPLVIKNPEHSTRTIHDDQVRRLQAAWGLA